MPYVQRKFYFPEDLYIALSLQAKQEGLRITDLVRTYVERGVRSDTRKRNLGYYALQELAKLGK